MFFSYISSSAWSGRLVPQKHDAPWRVDTKLRADYTPVVFTVKLPAEEDNWTLAQLVAKYPEPKL